MTATQAPAGGMTSKVNGQWYEGGEFMPVHGLFCGKSGAKRAAKWEQAKTSGIAVDLGGSQMYEVREYAGNGVWVVRGVAIADGETSAASAFVAKTKLYAKKI